MPDRIFDVEFGALGLVVSRNAGTLVPLVTTWTTKTDDGELLYEDGEGNGIWYQQIDLSELSIDSRTFKPMGVNVQRPYNGPEGQDSNFMPSTRPVELLYVFSNALANSEIRAGNVDLNGFRDLGLDASVGLYPTDEIKVIPDGSNTIFAQETKYFNSIANSVNSWNGFSVGPAGANPGDFYFPLLCADLSVAETNSWGEMRTILGPVLHCYRVILHETQNLASLDPASNPIALAAGFTDRRFSPVSIKIVCQENNLTEGAYLVEAANAYNNQTWDTSSEV